METAADIGFDLGTVDLGAGYGSDHIAFMLAGIDVIFLFADDVTYINSPTGHAGAPATQASRTECRVDAGSDRTAGRLGMMNSGK